MLQIEILIKDDLSKYIDENFLMNNCYMKNNQFK